jgi:hypothetical protein
MKEEESESVAYNASKCMISTLVISASFCLLGTKIHFDETRIEQEEACSYSAHTHTIAQSHTI